MSKTTNPRLSLRRLFCCSLAWVCLAVVGSASAEPPVEGTVSTELPNFPTKTLGGAQFWSDELVFHRWRIQRNVLSEHYRLLDENDFRRAWGTFEQCREKLLEIRREQNLPPMKGPAVITLHGLIRSRETMEGIGEYLEQEGDYTWLNVSYASTRRSLDEHAASLARVIENLEGIDEINFVCHSLGNLVVRRYLGEASQAEPKWKVDRRIKRHVMLGPPNNGAKLAEVFKNNKVFGLVLGPSAKQLAGQWPETERLLATPGFEFGIIAGRGNGLGTNPIVGGDDDLVVGIDETKLPGACDFLVVPRWHGELMSDKQVQQSTLRFLKKGCFVSADERQQIPAQSDPPRPGQRQ